MSLSKILPKFGRMALGPQFSFRFFLIYCGPVEHLLVSRFREDAFTQTILKDQLYVYHSHWDLNPPVFFAWIKVTGDTQYLITGD